MKKALMGFVAFSLIFGILLAPVSAFAFCNSSCATACPTACPTSAPMSCPESVMFVNDSGCAKHIKISYRQKGILGLFKRTIHLTLQGGEAYVWTYDNATTKDKKVNLKTGLFCSETKKVQTNQIWLLSEVKKGHSGMPFGASPKPVTSFL